MSLDSDNMTYTAVDAVFQVFPQAPYCTAGAGLCQRPAERAEGDLREGAGRSPTRPSRSPDRAEMTREAQQVRVKSQPDPGQRHRSDGMGLAAQPGPTRPRPRTGKDRTGGTGLLACRRFRSGRAGTKDRLADWPRRSAGSAKGTAIAGAPSCGTRHGPYPRMRHTRSIALRTSGSLRSSSWVTSHWSWDSSSMGSPARVRRGSALPDE